MGARMGARMDVILHVGAHRTATTSFQTYLRANRAALSAQGTGFWGPWRTRNGLLHGLADAPASGHQVERATGRLHLALEGARRHGADRLVVSDENMIGSARHNLRHLALYPAAGERLARLTRAFGPVRRVVLQIRALDGWWASAIGFLVPRGEDVPDAAALDRLAASPRSWRHVIADLACACPEAEIRVTPFECFADRPDHLLQAMTDLALVPRAAPGDFWKNRHPELPALRAALRDRGEDADHLPEGGGRWMPFDGLQAAALREAYADDLFWLRAGADGLANYTEDLPTDRTRANLASVLTERGQGHDRPARKLAQDR